MLPFFLNAEPSAIFVITSCLWVVAINPIRWWRLIVLQLFNIRVVYCRGDYQIAGLLSRKVVDETANPEIDLIFEPQIFYTHKLPCYVARLNCERNESWSRIVTIGKKRWRSEVWCRWDLPTFLVRRAVRPSALVRRISPSNRQISQPSNDSSSLVFEHHNSLPTSQRQFLVNRAFIVLPNYLARTTCVCVQGCVLVFNAPLAGHKTLARFLDFHCRTTGRCSSTAPVELPDTRLSRWLKYERMSSLYKIARYPYIVDPETGSIKSYPHTTFALEEVNIKFIEATDLIRVHDVL